MDWLAHLCRNTEHDSLHAWQILWSRDTLIWYRLSVLSQQVSGFTHVVDSCPLSWQICKVKAIRDEPVLQQISPGWGDFPRYGNDDDRADEIATTLSVIPWDWNTSILIVIPSQPHLSLLIASNVVYGRLQDLFRWKQEPPGATHLTVQSRTLVFFLNSVAKLDYEDTLDGISNTQTINLMLWDTAMTSVKRIWYMYDGYFDQGAHHLNVNVFGESDCAMNIRKSMQTTIRVSDMLLSSSNTRNLGERCARTCHDRM